MSSAGDADPSAGVEYNDLSGRSTDRLRGLVDGVFAVAMTLLVLDVRLPARHVTSDRGLWGQVADLGPHLAAYVLSFTMLGTFWLAEHTFLDRARRSDRMLSWACLAFLFFVSTLPFAASTLSRYPHLALAVWLYWLDLAGLGACMAWQEEWIRRPGLTDDIDGLQLVRRRLILAQTLYALAALVALVSPEASILALAICQLFFVISPRLPVRT